MDRNAEPLRFKLYAGEVIKIGESSTVPGTILTDHKTFLDVAAKDGFIRITDIQLSGKKRMQTADFLRGYVFPKNARFS